MQTAFSIDLLAEKMIPDMGLISDLPQHLDELAVQLQNIDIMTREKLALSKLVSFKQANKKLVFTNGVFDLLHRGHLSYLMHSRNRGDALIVAVNTDASVKRLNKKGDRPINPLSERLLMLAALPWVDFVVPFSEDTPVEVLKKIKPNLYTKAGDYSLDQLPEVPVMKALGGNVEIIPFEQGFSSSSIIEKAVAAMNA
jgi:rfaE bifunctional protein nucleotidyltransferase chain/domain